MKPVALIILSGLILPIFFCSMKKPADGCERFRNGKYIFKIRGKQKGEDILFLIERRDSIQTETEIKSGKYSKLSVKWTSNCVYEVKMLETSFSLPDSIQWIRRTVPFVTKIIGWADNYYVFKASRGNTVAITDTVWLVK